MKPRRYTSPAVLIHWAQAAVVLWLLGRGWSMVDLPKGAERTAAYGLHKSWGLVALGLIALRILWRRGHPPPPALSGGFEAAIARAVHHALYGLMLIAPLAGVVASQFTPYALKFFGLELPKLGWPDEAINGVFKIGSAGQAIGKNKQTLMAQLIDKSVVIAGNKLMVQWNALNKNFVPVALDSAMQNGAYGGLQISFKYYGNPPGDKSDSLMYLFDYAFAKNINYMELHCGTLRNLPEAAKYGYDLFHTRDGLITEDILVPHLYNNAPNPFVDFTYIKLTAKAPRKPMMQLFDCNGIFIREVSPVKVDEYEYLYFISGENLPSGTYTVYVKVREKQLGMKILKINK